jgi:hypothetical protein
MKNVFVALLLLSCGTQAPCDATSCATGCCDSNGTCRPGTAASACGKGGAACSSCATSCTAGVCDGASGGGTAGTGGGTSSGTGGGATATGGGSSASGGGTSASGGGTSASGGGTNASSGAVVNEIVARGGNEYVELYNPGSAAVDLSGYAVTDSHDDGGPDTGKSIRFETGTMLDSHAFALIMCGRDAGGPSTSCAGGSSCWEATWSISNSKGETVWILDPSDQVVAQSYYPPGGADAGRSYGRLPDGTGNFQETSKTPGAPNAP